jgi:8-oxo-dGTP pyrophosphatase MutT (NUDIX family)
MDKLKELLSKNSIYQHESITDKRGHKNASVFLPVFFNNEDYSILFLKRSKNLSAHSDEICFPGGTFENDDMNLLNTAYREMKEEIGVGQESVKLISPLSKEKTRTGYIIQPFIVLIKDEVKIKVDEEEIVDYMFISISELISKKNRRDYYFLSNKLLISKPAYIINNQLIWGATASILEEFLSIITSEDERNK